MSRLDDRELAMLADLTARQLGLVLTKQTRSGVEANLRILAGHAERVIDFAMPDPAAVRPEADQ